MGGGEIRLVGLVKRFEDVTAVDGIDLDVPGGEFFALLGPSGCGKTTTLRLVAGFEQPTDGRILLDGVDMVRTPPHKRKVNTVFQSYALFPFMSVADNVAFGLRRAGRPKVEIRQRVAEACEMVQLQGFEKRKPSQLSGGQQQRVALARALVNRPKVLLLDEPLGALDLKLRKELQLELRGLQHEVGITFVYVTHDQEEALTMSDRIAVMDAGVVRQVADPNTLYEFPHDRFVANFIGQTNMFSGRVESVDGDRVTLRTSDDVRIKVVKQEEVEVGAEAYAAVRPEKVRFGSEGDNVLSVEIRQVVYLGVSTQYIAERSGGGKIVLYQQNAHDSPGPAEGDEVSVAWDAGNCLVLGG